MIINLSPVTLAAIAICAVVPLPAAAADVADYVFNVPVNISALGPGHRAEVRCITRFSGGSVLVSEKTAPVPLDAGGNFSGTVPVTVSNRASVSSTGARLIADQYSCSLMLDGGTSTPPSKSATWTSRGNL